jgi:hypothetical protein
VEYLTRADREALEQLYALGSGKDADLGKIDGIALSVGDHRLRSSVAEFLRDSGKTQPQAVNQILTALRSYT